MTSKKPFLPNPSLPAEASAEKNFSIDSDRSIQLEIPSVTRLLDRKKLEIDQGVKDTPSPPAAGPASPAAKPTIKGAARAERRSQHRLRVWEEAPSGLAAAPSALESLVRSFRLKTGALWVLALAPQPSAPDFEAATILGGTRPLWNLLTGFHWGEGTAPAGFQRLTQLRRLELTACSDGKGGEKDAAALRSALALDPSLGLWMLACGPHQRPTGILMAPVADGKSVEKALEELSGQFGQPVIF
jgi:hypothetical protein